MWSRSLKKMLCCLVVTVITVLALTITPASHSGRTDANGGHYNHSTGEYHYHHGLSAHQHPGGVCPYQKQDTSEKDEMDELFDRDRQQAIQKDRESQIGKSYSANETSTEHDPIQSVTDTDNDNSYDDNQVTGLVTFAFAVGVPAFLLLLSTKRKK